MTGAIFRIARPMEAQLHQPLDFRLGPRQYAGKRRPILISRVLFDPRISNSLDEW